MSDGIDTGRQQPLSVLVVDDDPVTRSLMRKLLESGGYTVVEASNGRDGIRSFQQQPADAVITDIVMPDVEGIELIMTLRRESAAVPILAMSGGNSGMGPDYLEMAGKLGASATLSKPIVAGEVLATLSNCLQPTG